MGASKKIRQAREAQAKLAQRKAREIESNRKIAAIRTIANKRAPIMSLPLDVWIDIANNLDMCAIIRLSETCHGLRERIMTNRESLQINVCIPFENVFEDSVEELIESFPNTILNYCLVNFRLSEKLALYADNVKKLEFGNDYRIVLSTSFPLFVNATKMKFTSSVAFPGSEINFASDGTVIGNYSLGNRWISGIDMRMKLEEWWQVNKLTELEIVRPGVEIDFKIIQDIPELTVKQCNNHKNFEALGKQRKLILIEVKKIPRITNLANVECLDLICVEKTTTGSNWSIADFRNKKLRIKAFYGNPDYNYITGFAQLDRNCELYLDSYFVPFSELNGILNLTIQDSKTRIDFWDETLDISGLGNHHKLELSNLGYSVKHNLHNVKFLMLQQTTLANFSAAIAACGEIGLVASITREYMFRPQFSNRYIDMLINSLNICVRIFYENEDACQDTLGQHFKKIRVGGNKIIYTKHSLSCHTRRKKITIPNDREPRCHNLQLVYKMPYI